MSASIKVVIDETTGDVVMEGVGFKGKACDKAMAALEKAIGTTAKRTNKPEYFAAETTVKQTIGGAK